MKKVISFILVLVIVMSMAACNSGTTTPSINDTTTSISVESTNENSSKEDVSSVASTSKPSASNSTSKPTSSDSESSSESSSSEVGSKVENNVSSESTSSEKPETSTTESSEPESTPTPKPTPTPTPKPADPAHTHKWTARVTKPTCTENGYTTQSCSCGESYVEERVDATGHSFGEWKTTKEPTTTTTGVSERKCSTCGETETKTLGKVTASSHTHSYTSKVTTNATCTKTGVKTFTCSCGDSYTESIEKTSHSYKSTVVAPTCTNGGYTSYTCSCGDSYVSDKTEAKGHSYSENTVAPTCTASGYTKHTCSVCGNFYTDNNTPSTGHAYELVSNTANCATGGVKTEKCANCGDTKTTNIAAGKHVNTSTERYEPSCYEEGYEIVTCDDCGTTISETTLPMVDHCYVTMPAGDAYYNYGVGSSAWNNEWTVSVCTGYCGEYDPLSFQSAYSDYETAAIMLGYVNELRTSVFGTSDYNLVLSDELISLAKVRAQQIEYDFSHNGRPSGTGENIAKSGVATIYEQFAQWQNSSGHYANMIDSTYTQFGYARWVNPDAYVKNVCGVQLFR